jgi:hypothetical protein
MLIPKHMSDNTDIPPHDVSKGRMINAATGAVIQGIRQVNSQSKKRAAA